MAHEVNTLSTSIKKKLDRVFENYSGFSIKKLPAHVRNVNEQAHEPQIIAIGPYSHHLRGKNHLVEMEQHKIRYLKNLIRRKGEDMLTNYPIAVNQLQDRARSCYAESISLESDEFVEMMLLDACFIVELFRYNGQINPRGYNDPVFRKDWIRRKLGRDLLLVENQLPFCVLQEFYNMTMSPGEEKKFHELIWHFFKSVIQEAPSSPEPLIGSNEEIKHLLDFIHNYFWAWELRPLNNDSWCWKLIRCATEPKEAGIKFEENIATANLFSIEFDEDKGIMKIPKLVIRYDTESLFRNLIAYEQFSFVSLFNSPFINYLKFMDCLINTEKDVKILCDSGILDNYLGDEEVVAKVINRVADSVWLSPYNYYGDIFRSVNEYCNRSWNRWIANLWHNYFNTPWAIISFLAALLLLILTGAQTVFSVLSYFQ